MPDPDQSLMPLDLAPAAITAREEADGRYTAVRFRQSRPQSYQLILQRLREGASNNRIVREFRDHGQPLHERTVQAILEQNFTPQQIREFRAATFARGAKVAADIAVEALSDAYAEVDQIDKPADRVKAKASIASVAGVQAGILNQNAELLAGHATHRVEEVTVHDDHADYQRLLAQARADALKVESRIANAKPILNIQVETQLPPATPEPQRKEPTP